MEIGVSDDQLLSALVPIIVLWVYSGFYEFLGQFEKYRLHSKKEEDEKNLVKKKDVIRVVLFYQLAQAFFSILLSIITGSQNQEGGMKSKKQSLTVIATQFIVAMIVFDAWQHFMHRLMHKNKFLYRHVHSKHHRLVVPYSYGAQYTHPVDAFLLDILGGIVTHVVSGMSSRTAMYFFSFATIKSVDDHCGIWLPWNPFHFFFSNNTAYHDVHHQLHGGMYNYSQMFFVIWDRILGSYMPYSLEKRVDGGFEAKAIKYSKDD